VGEGVPAKDEVRRRVAARLQQLERMGLAGKDRLGRWAVDAELKRKLREIAQSNDIVKNLYAKLGPRSGAVASYRGGELIGRVMSMGAHDELRDRRFLAVENKQGGIYYVRPVNTHALRPLEEGGLVRIRPLDSKRQAKGKDTHGGFGLVEVLSARSVPSQIEAQAWTWLDRQIHLRALGKASAVLFDPLMQEAVQARQHWMLKHGYAQIQDGQYALNRGARKTLLKREWQTVAGTLHQRFGAPVHSVGPGGEGGGIYRGTIALHAGLYAAVTQTGQVHLVPVRQPPRLNPGSAVRAIVDARGHGTLTLELRRQKEQETERG
jgi:hypothetical protein